MTVCASLHSRKLVLHSRKPASVGHALLWLVLAAGQAAVWLLGIAFLKRTINRGLGCFKAKTFPVASRSRCRPWAMKPTCCRGPSQ